MKIKVCEIFKRFTIGCGVVAGVLIILGVILQGFNWNIAISLWAIAFALILLPVVWFLRSLPQPI